MDLPLPLGKNPKTQSLEVTFGEVGLKDYAFELVPESPVPNPFKCLGDKNVRFNLDSPQSFSSSLRQQASSSYDLQKWFIFKPFEIFTSVEHALLAHPLLINNDVGITAELLQTLKVDSGFVCQEDLDIAVGRWGELC